jgi:NAD(P)-dependent dehydrogenase (short-subunit alcohol dehydrogenase family)
VIGPGPISGTEGMDRLNKTHKAGDDKGARAIPCGRYGIVKELADVTVYLFSDAGNYVISHTIVLDGGAWHTAGGNPSADFIYPDFILRSYKVVMITGACRGIGRHWRTCAFPTAVAKSIIIIARKLETLKDTEDMIKKINSKIEVFPIALEVTNEESVEHAFKALGEKYGSIGKRLWMLASSISA